MLWVHKSPRCCYELNTKHAAHKFGIIKIPFAIKSLKHKTFITISRARVSSHLVSRSIGGPIAYFRRFVFYALLGRLRTVVFDTYADAHINLTTVLWLARKLEGYSPSASALSSTNSKRSYFSLCQRFFEHVRPAAWHTSNITHIISSVD